MQVASEKLTFPGAQGHDLAARLDRPAAGAPTAYALFAHCFTCTKDIFAAGRIAQALAGRGIATLRFDFTGLGASDGDFANTNFSSNVQDLVAAGQFLRGTGRAARLIVGHSLGGAAVLKAAGELPEIRAVATIGAPAEPAHVSHHFTGALAEIEEQGEADILLVGRPFKVRKQFLDDIRESVLAGAIEALGRAGKALLVFHAPTDATVGIGNAAKIYGAARHPKSFVSLDGADHLLSKRADAEYVAEVLATWAGRYLDMPAAPAFPRTRAGETVVTEAGLGRFRQAISVGPHRLTADEPEAVGGTDQGPSPYGLLTAALGACTTMTIRMYADRKGWPLDRVSVTVRHDKVHADDCAACETRDGRIDEFRRELVIDGALTDEQRQRLLDIAGKCPVHRTLTSETRVVTTVTE